MEFLRLPFLRFQMKPARAAPFHSQDLVDAGMSAQFDSSAMEGRYPDAGEIETWQVV
jgi:hypothetical protein